MRNIITLIVLFLSLTISAQNEFTLNLSGKISNAPDTPLLIFHSSDDEKVDDMEVFAEIKLKKSGKFKSKLVLPNMDYYKLGFSKDDYFVLVVDGDKKIHLTADAENWLKDFTVKGSVSTDKFNSFSGKLEELSMIGDSLDEVYKANPAALEEIIEFYSGEIEKFFDKANVFISENEGSTALLSVLSVYDIKDEEDRAIYKQILFSLNDNFGESTIVKEKVAAYHDLVEEYEAEEALKIKKGDKAKEISLANPAGEILNLSDYKGQIVLLDFWASWCGPCRVENPNVVALYEKYKDKGFTVFSVSFDTKEENWLQAIEKDGLVWDAHVSDLKGWKSEAGQTYRINAIPTTFLIDENGTIIARDLRGKKLAEKLSELFD